MHISYEVLSGKTVQYMTFLLLKELFKFSREKKQHIDLI